MAKPIKKPAKPRFVNKEKFAELIQAVYNIGPDVEPGDKEGERVNEGAMDAISHVYTLLGNPGKGYATGVLLALRLFVEHTCAADVEAYVEQEIERGENGDRCMDDDPGIELPKDVESKDYDNV